MDKDKVLPLIDGLAVTTDWDETTDIVDAVTAAQRDEDWERVKPLVKALKAIAKWPCIANLAENLDYYICKCPYHIAKAALAEYSIEKLPHA